jgi:hypothetical protein
VSNVPVALFVIALLAIPIICGYALYRGFSTGRMPARGASYSRKDSPVLFWVLASMYAALPIFELSMVGPIVWRIVRGR